ncbi:MAG: PEP-CTERM sorting domain-containing protein [Planctomycetota bacterium]
MKFKIQSAVYILVATLVSPAAICADAVLDATDAGFVTELGGSAKGDGTITPPATYNYSVGQELHYSDGSLGTPPGTTPLAYMDRNNYFIFDTTGIDGIVVGAALTLPAGMFESVDSFETFHLVAPLDPGAALGDADMLAFAHTFGSTEFDEPFDPMVSVAMALYGNIEGGSGDILATSLISSSDDFTTLSIEFEPLGIDYINSLLGGEIFFGGTVSTITPGSTTEQPFGFTGGEFPKLELMTVPEPGSASILLTVAGCFGLRRRKCVGQPS